VVRVPAQALALELVGALALRVVVARRVATFKTSLTFRAVVQVGHRLAPGQVMALDWPVARWLAARLRSSCRIAQAHFRALARVPALVTLHQHCQRGLVAGDLAPVVVQTSDAPANREIDLETSAGRAHPVIGQRTLVVPVDRAIDRLILVALVHRVIDLEILAAQDVLTLDNQADPILADRAAPAEIAFRIFQAESLTEASGRIGVRTI
jgi:hypothetical protein